MKTPTPTRARYPSRLLIVGLLTALLCVPRAAVWSADQQGVDVDTGRATLKQWVETRRILSQEKRDLALALDVLNERIDLVQHELDTQNDKIGEVEASMTEANDKKAELMAENATLQAALSSLNHRVGTLETQTLVLLKQLPDPIRERVRPLSQRLPGNRTETMLSLADRYQTIIGILNEVNKFNREISVTSEVRTLPDGTAAEVTALYLGIGQAYYVNHSRSVAGVGTASPDGWAWTPANAAAEQIANAIAILKNEQVAAFVRLPIALQTLAPE